MTNEASEVLVHEAAGYCFLLAGEQLVIRREDQEQARLNLAPATDRQWGLQTWRREGERYVAAVQGLEAEVVVGLTPTPSPHGSEERGEYGYLFYEVRTQEGFFPSFTYFPDSRIQASRWQTFVYNSDDRAWVADQDKEVGVTAASVVLGEVQAAWYTNVAPHVAAYCLTPSVTLGTLGTLGTLEEGRGPWLGVCVPGPLPVAKMRFCWASRRFSLRFDHLRPSCEEGRMPRVYLAPGLPEPEAALEVHAALTRALGYRRDRSHHPAWWSQPVWGLYDENCWVGGSGVNPPPPERSPLTPARVQEWAERVERITGLAEFFVMAEQGYFSRYGEFEPVASLGRTEGMRRLIDDLHREGKRVGLYFHPFFIDLRIPEVQQHPEWLAQGEASPSAVPISPDMQVRFVDWTHPDARDYLRRRIHYLLSPEPGGLNADWLCVHNNHVPDPRQWKFHDPHFRVAQFALTIVRGRGRMYSAFGSWED